VCIICVRHFFPFSFNLIHDSILILQFNPEFISTKPNEGSAKERKKEGKRETKWHNQPKVQPNQTQQVRENILSRKKK
jgi:hypothetical protein